MSSASLSPASLAASYNAYGDSSRAIPLSADSILQKALDQQDKIWADVGTAVDAWALEAKVKSLRTQQMTSQIHRRRNVTEQLEERLATSLRSGVELLRAQMRDTPSTFHPDGFQSYTFASRDTYEGEWKNTIMHGRGKLISVDGQEYDGEWFLGIRAGSGSFKCKQSNTTYTGRWYEGRRHGKGELTEPEGSYRGEFRDGMVHGNGEYTYVDGHRYRGDWQRDRYHGTGTYTMPSGARYEGEWEEGLQHGKGVAVIDRNSTEVYMGEWQLGKRHGRGTLKSTSLTFTGDWRFDSISGNGTATWANGATYEGTFDRSVQHGQGKLTEPNGRSYSGEWQYGKRHGFGIYKSATGRASYEGQWQEDLKHGKGVVKLDIVGVIAGCWKKDQLHGPAIFTSNHGDKSALEFEDGVCVTRHDDEHVSKVCLSLSNDEA